MPSLEYHIAPPIVDGNGIILVTLYTFNFPKIIDAVAVRRNPIFSSGDTGTRVSCKPDLAAASTIVISRTSGVVRNHPHVVGRCLFKSRYGLVTGAGNLFPVHHLAATGSGANEQPVAGGAGGGFPGDARVKRNV